MEPQFTYWYGNKCDPCKLDSHRWETITTHRGIYSSVSGYLGSSGLPQYSRSSGIKQNVGLTWIQFHAYIQPGQPWSLLDLPHTRSRAEAHPRSRYSQMWTTTTTRCPVGLHVIYMINFLGPDLAPASQLGPNCPGNHGWPEDILGIWTVANQHNLNVLP